MRRLTLIVAVATARLDANATEYFEAKLLRQWERWRGAWRSPLCLSAQLLSNAPRIGFYNRRVKG